MQGGMPIPWEAPLNSLVLARASCFAPFDPPGTFDQHVDQRFPVDRKERSKKHEQGQVNSKGLPTGLAYHPA